MQRMIECLAKCAEAHGREWETFYDVFDEEGNECLSSFVIFGDAIPLLSDVLSIVCGFYGYGGVNAVSEEPSFNCIEVDLWGYDLLPSEDIDWDAIRLALPCDFTHITL